ncbi:MAG: tetratricopeptide repeat protein [Planctomycetaceae bacterium]|nr:tetratricopeptide repeat protein [Planctomycetaceae bacterium]
MARSRWRRWLWPGSWPGSWPGKPVALGLAVPVAVLAFVVGGWCAATWSLRSARLSLARGEFAAALTALDAAERWQPGRAETAFEFARAYRRSGDLDRGEEWLQSAARRGWSAEEITIQRFLASIQSGRFDQAEPWLSRVLRAGVSDDLAEEIYEAQAKGYLNSYRLNDAVVCLNFWIQWKPRAVQPRIWLADAWERCDRWQSAAGEFQAIVDLAPNHREARRRLADNLLILNDVAGAFQHFQICARETPDDDAVALGLARCLRRLGRLEEAERSLSQLLGRHPDNKRPVDALVEQGQIALDLRQTVRAVALLEQAVRADPGHALAQSTLAGAYLKSGEIEQAEQHRILAERIKQRFERLTEIIGQLTDAPGNADLRHEAGMVLMEQGLRAEGARWMATALLVDAHHHPTHAALEEYFASIGDSDRAAQHRRLSHRDVRHDPRTKSPALSE